MELWAEIRRLRYVEGLSQREIHRRTGVHRDTIRSALASSTPPVYGPRLPRPSKLDAFVWRIEELLADEPTLSGVRIREELEMLGYEGGKTIIDDLLRELRPRFLPPPRSYQRTRYDWLAGCLLVPGSGIRTTMRLCGGNLDAAAEHYGVSVQLMRWRHNARQWRPRKQAA